MGRQIPTDRPLSDEDRAFLVAWSRTEDIARIDATFPPGSAPAPAPAPAPTPDLAVVADDEDDDGVEVDVDISDRVEAMKVAELRKELQENDIPFSQNANRDELVATLAIALQEKRDAGRG